jgi:5'-nucleotidase
MALSRSLKTSTLKTLALLTPLAAGIVAPGLALADDPRAPAVLRLLHVNDVYEVAPNDEGLGGLAELATMVAAAEAKPGADDTIVTFGGDLISPSLLSSIDQGKHMITAMGMVGVDMAVPGNHEFDFGGAVFAEHLKTSPFPWFAANVLDANEQPYGGMVATAMRTVGAYKVGFLGVLTEDTTVLSSPGDDVLFLPALDKAREAAAALKSAGADVIVALTHLDFADDKALAEEVPDIDVILGGHDHDPITWLEAGTLILKAGTDAEYLAEIDLTIKEVQGRKALQVNTIPSWSLIPVTGVTPEPKIAAKVAEWQAILDKELGQPLATTETELDSQRSTVRSKESSMGNLITDAMRAFAKTDVALTNGGGIRGDKVYEAGTTLTRKDMVSEMPFGNVVVVLEVTGAQLKAALENGFSEIENGGGRFPQVSGLTVSYDPAKPAGGRVVAVTVGGAPLDPAKTYTLATNDYMAGGGDGYAALSEGKVVVDASAGRLMAAVVADYVGDQGKVAPKPEGRVTAAR